MLSILILATLIICSWSVSALPQSAVPTGLVPSGQAQSGNAYLQDALSIVAGLQKSYWSPGQGIWDGRWWNSARVVTAYAELARWRGSRIPTSRMDFQAVFATVFSNAPVPASEFGGPGFRKADPTVGHYDDDLWWCLAWIAVYRTSGDPAHIGMAKSLFLNAAQNWPAGIVNPMGRVKVCEGIQWSKDDVNSGVQTIENALFLKAAAQLHAIQPDPTVSAGLGYDGWAQRIWRWFQSAGLLETDPATGRQHLVYDGLGADCRAVKKAAGELWSYNTGVLIGALSHYTQAIPGDGGRASAQADASARAAMAYFSWEKNPAAVTTSVLREVRCEPGPALPSTCDADAAQFKGILAANVMDHFLTSSQQPEFKAWLQTNANAIVRFAVVPDVDGDGDGAVVITESWTGGGGTGMTETSSGLEAVVGAACVTDM